RQRRAEQEPQGPLKGHRRGRPLAPHHRLLHPPLRYVLLRTRRPLRPTLFPYTTLFRSLVLELADVPQLRAVVRPCLEQLDQHPRDRKSTRLNSSHSQNSYAVFCLKKKKIEKRLRPFGPAAAPPPTIAVGAQPTSTVIPP